MTVSRAILRRELNSGALGNLLQRFSPPLPWGCPTCRHISKSSRRSTPQPADNPDFMSIVDNPPNLVRTGKRHGPGLIVLGTQLHEAGIVRLADSRM